MNDFGDAAQIGHVVIARNVKRSEKVNAVNMVDGGRADGDNAHAALCLILDVSEKLRGHAAGGSREAGDHRRELYAVLDLHIAYLYRRENMRIFIERAHYLNTSLIYTDYQRRPMSLAA